MVETESFDKLINNNELRIIGILVVAYGHFLCPLNLGIERLVQNE